MSTLCYRMHWKKKNKFLKMNGMIWILNGKLLKIQGYKISICKLIINFKGNKLVLIKTKFKILNIKFLEEKKLI